MNAAQIHKEGKCQPATTTNNSGETRTWDAHVCVCVCVCVICIPLSSPNKMPYTVDMQVTLQSHPEDMYVYLIRSRVFASSHASNNPHKNNSSLRRHPSIPSKIHSRRYSSYHHQDLPLCCSAHASEYIFIYKYKDKLNLRRRSSLCRTNGSKISRDGLHVPNSPAFAVRWIAKRLPGIQRSSYQNQS